MVELPGKVPMLALTSVAYRLMSQSLGGPPTWINSQLTGFIGALMNMPHRKQGTGAIAHAPSEPAARASAEEEMN